MNYSYCPTCRAEVQDTGGFCLLGHRIGPPLASLSELRAEVDSAFDAARSRVAEVLKTPPPAPPPLPPVYLPPREEITPTSGQEPAPHHEPPTRSAEPARHLAPTTSEAAFFASGNGSHSLGDAGEAIAGAAVVAGQPEAEPSADAVPPADPRVQPAVDNPLPTSRGLETLWGAISPERSSGDAHDPITAFAPVPSMDWGPERQLPRRKGRKGKQP